MPATASGNCARCRQPLAAGSHYCVACGYSNEGVVMERAAKIGIQIENRRARFKFWTSMANIFRIVRWFR